MLAENHWYFVGSDRRRYGPYPLATLRGYIRSGHVTPQTLVWEPGFGSEWRAARLVEGLIPPAEPAPIPVPAPVPLTLPGAPQPLQPPIAGGPLVPPTGHPMAYGAYPQRPVYQTYPQQAATPQVKSHLVFAIVSMVAVFLPAGVVATMYASKVDALVKTGDVNGAKENSRKAYRWCILACAIGGGQLAVSLIGIFVFAALR